MSMLYETNKKEVDQSIIDMLNAFGLTPYDDLTDYARYEFMHISLDNSYYFYGINNYGYEVNTKEVLSRILILHSLGLSEKEILKGVNTNASKT
jgi:hypothetical protein